MSSRQFSPGHKHRGANNKAAMMSISQNDLQPVSDRPNKLKETFMKKNSISLAVAAVVLISGCATLKNTFESSPFASAFNKLDEDGDGVVSKQEAQELPPLAQDFNSIDVNRSGGLDPNEFAAATTFIADLSFEEVDINGDGVISPREADAMPISLREAFGTVDADTDGNVSPVEYQAASVNLLDGVSFGSIDTDGDGVVGTREAEEVPLLSDMYDPVDTDADGLISREEYEAAQRR
jgi:hypothetical protein